jgi:hypothetical protein
LKISTADADARARKRERAVEREKERDAAFVTRFASRARELFPLCPPGSEREIAEHACLKYSGRVGRTAAARALDENAVSLAVQAHVRHRETDYDERLAEDTALEGFVARLPGECWNGEAPPPPGETP